MQKLLFFDIDGTLANGKVVPQSAQAALEEVRSQGHLVFICTGRPLGYVTQYFSSYADGFVCSNGRYACLKGETIYDHPMSDEEMTFLLSGMSVMDYDVALFDQQHGYYSGDEKEILAMRRIWGPGFMLHGLPDDHRPIYNFDIFFGSYDKLPALKAYFKDYFIFNNHYPHPSADTTIVGVDKSTTIVKIAEKLGCDMAHVYAFGDGENDVTMIQRAGVGIAMGNAIDELKAVADFITKPINEDGVAYALQHYGFIEKIKTQ